MSNTSTPPPVDVAALRTRAIPTGIKFQKLAFLSYAGVMQKVTFEVPFVEIAERLNFDRLLQRHDYDIDAESLPGNRDITDSHVKKIAEGIQSTDRPYLGTITVAMPAEHVEIEEVQPITERVSLVMITVREGAPNPVIEDGQHRVKMVTTVWPMVKNVTEGTAADVRKYLEDTSVEMTMLLEGDGDILSTIFVRMGSTKPISPNLIAVMDKSTYQNRLGLYVTKHSKLLADRVSYLSTTASRALAAKKGRSFDPLYPAAAVRSTVASIAGVGVRDRTPEQREQILTKIIEDRARVNGTTVDAVIELLGQEIMAILDYAYTQIPGWKEIGKQKLTVAEFKKGYVHSSAAGLHVIANVIAAARLQGLNTHMVINELAKLPWERSALRAARDENGEPIEVHEFFEGTLASTSYDVKSGAWRAGTGGPTRTNYEPAIDKVLRYLSGQKAVLKVLGERETMIAIGLVTARRGPGRPRKAEVGSVA